jgi:hypothetical protein
MSECAMVVLIIVVVQSLAFFFGHYAFTHSTTAGIKVIDNVELEASVMKIAKYIVDGLDGNDIVRCESYFVDHDSPKIWVKLDKFEFPLREAELAIQNHLRFAALEYMDLEGLLENSITLNETALGEVFEIQLKDSLGVRISYFSEFNLACRLVRLIIGSSATSVLDWCQNQKERCGLVAWQINFRVNVSVSWFRNDLDKLLVDSHFQVKQKKSYFQAFQRILVRDLKYFLYLILIVLALGAIMFVHEVIRFAGGALLEVLEDFT